MSWYFLNVISPSVYIMVPAVPFKRKTRIFKFFNQISLIILISAPLYTRIPTTIVAMPKRIATIQSTIYRCVLLLNLH